MGEQEETCGGRRRDLSCNLSHPGGVWTRMLKGTQRSRGLRGRKP